MLSVMPLQHPSWENDERASLSFAAAERTDSRVALFGLQRGPSVTRLRHQRFLDDLNCRSFDVSRRG